MAAVLPPPPRQLSVHTVEVNEDTAQGGSWSSPHKALGSFHPLTFCFSSCPLGCEEGCRGQDVGRREQTGGGDPQPPAPVLSHEEGWIQPQLPSQPRPSLSCGRSACELSGEIHGQALEPRPAVSSSKGLGAPCSWGLPRVHTGPWVNLFFNFIDKGTKAGGWGPDSGTGPKLHCE